MRRQPVYFLIDTAKSMSGLPINSILNCLKKLIQNLKEHPSCIEIVEVSVITYGNDKKRVVIPFSSITSFELLPLFCSGKSDLNKALKYLEEDYHIQINQTASTKKADFKPMLFIFTGIAPQTDLNEKHLSFLHNKFSLGFIHQTEASICSSTLIESSIDEKNKHVIILTSGNDYVVKWFNKYFTSIYNYKAIDTRQLTSLF